MPNVPGSRYPEFSDEAEANLDAIEEYISGNNSEAARRLIIRIRDICVSLAEQPYMGVARPEFNRPNLRSFVVRNTPYVIFYYPIEDGVQIAYIRHGSRNLADLFE
jgi:plasmid stabilization system protein ParE